MALASWNAVARGWVNWIGQKPTEMYYMGDLDFGSGQPAGTQVDYFTCGTEGGVGPTPELTTFPDVYDTSKVTEWYNSTLGCTPTSNSWTALPVEMQFGNDTATTQGAATYVNQTFQVLTNLSGSYVPGAGLGITSWMIGLNLTNSAHQTLPPAQSGCSTWVPTLEGYCGGNANGWYAVLLSAAGAWQGSYGAVPGGLGWTNPVIPIVSNETLAIVAPASWDLAGDSLIVTSTTSLLPVTGSTLLA
jgi:hypothetical protein